MVCDMIYLNEVVSALFILPASIFCTVITVLAGYLTPDIRGAVLKTILGLLLNLAGFLVHYIMGKECSKGNCLLPSYFNQDAVYHCAQMLGSVLIWSGAIGLIQRNTEGYIKAVTPETGTSKKKKHRKSRKGRQSLDNLANSMV